MALNPFGTYDNALDANISDEMRRLQDPGYGLSAFQQLAASSAPTLDTFLSGAAARGGSQLAAREAAQAASGRARGQAFGAFSQFRLQADDQVGGLLGLLSGRDLTRRKLDLRRDLGMRGLDIEEQRLALERRKQEEAEEGPGFGGILGGILGTGLGALAGGVGASVGGALGSKIGGALY